MLLKEQDYISPQTGQPVNVISDSSKRVAESGETVALYYYNSGTYTVDAGQAAGVAVIGQLSYSPVLDSGGTKIATINDKSLSFTCDAFTTEKPFNWRVFEEYKNATGTNLLTQITADFDSGDYCVDYLRGTIYGVKATTTSSMTSVGYKRLSNASDVTIESITVGDVAIGAVEIKDASTDTRAKVKSDGTDDALVVAMNSLPTLPAGTNKIGDIGLLGNSSSSGLGYEYHLVADSSGQLKVSSTTVAPTVLTGGTTTVTTPSTAVVLGTTLAIKSVYIRALPTNTSFICVGDVNVDQAAAGTQQILLYANDSVTIDIADRATVYIDADVGTEGVSYLCMG
jgi:hypothetical protein